ncbi:type II/IV secretion system protein [Psychrobacillus sp. INOP01]|uniref:GspE/PulE family protein n=1 Tax=Psychrobacillus sp. INOP01 TaxID=2829187 RepID=UPI001BA99D17|nr:GspE/PulE family protein [Psychrobacillus sp. INOP01]QUG42243.1 type II/IV secretion system protein [Psychrobacillus sp. INOP01]
MAIRKRLGDLLVEASIISEDQLQMALQKKTPGQRLGDALVERGYLTDRQLIEVLEFQLGIAHVALNLFPIDTKLIQLVGSDYSRQNYALPIEKDEQTIKVAMADPLDYVVIDDIELMTGFTVQPVISSRKDILETIDKLTKEAASIALTENLSQEGANEDEAPAIRLVNQILSRGIQIQASDIHIDAHEDKVLVRYRVDGLLATDRVIQMSQFPSLVARIKIMANLNITESRLPQDGRVRLTQGQQTIDMRISILPTVYGEKMVIRLLDLANAVKPIYQLGFNKRYVQTFIELIEKPTGLVLLTGPTGSGKTTTLYSALQHINQESVNIITIEDPVEYQMEGINQVQVNPHIQLTFASGLRAILRQDPNIVMVGEIRDEETAEITIRAALTGHLVLSTLHTNDAISTIPRLLDMNIEPYLVISALNGAVSQRLVRKICDVCKEEYIPSSIEQELFDKRFIKVEKLFRGRGCKACSETGFKGRLSIHEIFVVDNEIRELLYNNRSMTEVKRTAMKNGMIPLIDDGLLKVKAGYTTVEEVLRVAKVE